MRYEWEPVHDPNGIRKYVETDTNETSIGWVHGICFPVWDKDAWYAEANRSRLGRFPDVESAQLAVEQACSLEDDDG